MKQIKKDLPQLNEATTDAQLLAHVLYRLSGAVDPTVENGEDCLKQLRIGRVRSLMNDLSANLEALGI